ncbi:MAG: VCBS repeat-containing protein, partial [Pyrinomonadaceae bacterium]|nr:VCBS repeat-containing protein [Pyrinomonadaceae bacterium]
MTLENGGGISFLTDLDGGCIYVPLGTVMHLDQMVVQQCSSDFGGGISTRGNLYINRSTIRNNTARLGGGIFVGEEGTLTISNSTINNNGGNQGGGINNNGDYMTLTITNCTISNNFATLDGFPDSPAHGGGIFNYGPLVLTNVTIAGNIGIPYAGGIADWASIYGLGPSQIRNTIIANNSSDTLFDIFTYGLISNGNNLLGAGPINGMEDGIDGDIVGTYELPLNPLLDPLSNNGGPTATHALLAGSRAINKGNKCVFEGTCLSTPLLTDQRGVGFARRIGISVDIGAFESDSSVTMRRTPFDFDGDGKSDPSVYRPSAGEWWWLKSSNGNTGAVQFGISTDNVASADYTGDGKTDVAFWRPSTGQWFVLRSEDFSFFAFPFGATGDVPVPADYDGDGKADAAVFRESSLTWFISKSSGGTDIVGFGAAGDKPVNADYDGDGKADIAVFRPNGANGAEWWIRRSSNASVFATQFGSPTDKAVPADYTGDGKADIAFWTPSNGNWFILRSEDLSYFAFPFGSSTDIPAPGDYDGDSKTDAAVFRPSNSTWYANRSTAGLLMQQFGSTGDVPIPSAYVR